MNEANNQLLLKKYFLYINFLSVFTALGAQKPLVSKEFNSKIKIDWLSAPVESGSEYIARIKALNANNLRKKRQKKATERRKHCEECYKISQTKTTSHRYCVSASYEQEFDSLVQAVLKGNNATFKRLLKSGKFDVHQKLPFGRNLRHIAYNKYINSKLLALGVATTEEGDYVFEPSDCDKAYGMRGNTYFKGPDPDNRDVYDKFPEDYTVNKKIAIAQDMMRSRYVYVSEKVES